jgi:tRNA-dihydrouridine synthase A
MMDWTDRHCRFFHRQLSRHARLYTEMVATGALLHGDLPRHLDHDPAEAPLALQVGGSEPADLIHAARLAEAWGYAEINLNCGCPSERVQHGAFGACLMAEPKRVAECFRAMRDTVSIPVTVKHRIGLGRGTDESMVQAFVGALFDAGCRVFIVHARNAWLEGLSPRENREVPPLRPDVAERLGLQYPSARIVVNGGVDGVSQAAALLARFDGVMLGRAAYHTPAMLGEVDRGLFDPLVPVIDPFAAVGAMHRYLHRQVRAGVPPRAVVRHMLGLFLGRPGARRWRRDLSDPAFLDRWGADALMRATDQAFGEGARPPEPDEVADDLLAGAPA